MTEKVERNYEEAAVRPEETTVLPPKKKKQKRPGVRQLVIHAEGMHKHAPAVVAVIVVIAAFVVAVLVSYAQLVMVNDSLVALRKEMTQLKTEETKLVAQYELSYDMQGIEQQMLSSGLLTKIQPGQTYTLELAEPDSVEYYQASGFLESLTAGAKTLLSAVVEYF